jgi:hypothetical protein
MRGGSTQYTFDLDQVRVNAVPEPAAALLAAIGGWLALAFVHRRDQ